MKATGTQASSIETGLLFKTFLAQNLYPVLIIDPQGKVLDINEKALAVLEAGPGQMNLADFCSPQDLALLIKGTSDHLPPDFISNDIRVKTCRQHQRSLQVTGFPLLQDGTISQILCLLKDISSEKSAAEEQAREKSRQLEKEVQSEKRRFLEMFAQAPVMMAILKGPRFVFEKANESYYKFSGRTPSIIGMSVMDVFPEAEGQGIFELMQQVYSTGEMYSVNERHLQLDTEGKGQLKDFYLSFMFQPYINPENEVEGIFYFGVDVTEQVHARKKIEDSKKQYVDIIENLPAAVYTCDPKGEILLYNSAAVHLWQRNPELHKDRWCGSWKIYTTEGERVSHEESPMAITIKERSEGNVIEMQIQRPDGSFRYVVSFPSSLFDSNHHLTGGINVLIDITDRKQEEEEMKKLSLIARNTINAVLIVDKSGAIEWVNDAFTRITEFSFEEAFGKKPSALLHGPETDPATVQWMNSRMQQREPFETEIIKYSKSGKKFWVEVQAQPLFDTEGNFVRYFIMETDISERKAAYESLVRKENEVRSFARQLNNMLEDERSHIAREIHDEFGQQLSGLKMSLSSLKSARSLDPPGKEMLGDLLDDLERSIASLRKISTELRPGILDTLGLVPSIQWLTREFEKKTGIECLVKNQVTGQLFDKELSIAFFRVCQEALTNVSKHAQASKVAVKLVEEDGQLSMSITDNGKGIHQEKLANPFSMGLVGMRERANLVEGQLTISNNDKAGTLVQLTAPLNKPHDD